MTDKDTIEFFLNKYSYNFGRTDSVKFLAAGGENVIFRMNPFVPVEVIAKATKSAGSFNDILLENHFLRLASNERYICKVLEEIVAYSEKSNQILFLLAIVESAENDLLNMANIWSSEEQ